MRVPLQPLETCQARILQGMRALQQEGVVTVVETAEALQEAVVAGKFHIEIRAHLDLTVLDLINGTSYILGEIPVTVRSIRVCCWLCFPPVLQPPQPAPHIRVSEVQACATPTLPTCKEFSETLIPVYVGR